MISHYLKSLFFAFCSLLILSCSQDIPSDISTEIESLPKEINFNKHIKPILSDKCFACHGPDRKKIKGGVKLDEAQSAFTELKKNKGHYAITPGNLANSEVFNRIITKDPELIMPPPEFQLTLSTREKAFITKWIDQGAQYQKHWSLIPVKKVEIPNIENDNWSKNEIDKFVLEELNNQKLSPSEQASKELLIRRVSFDLTGLPPTLEEINSYVNDKSDNAFEKVVDRLLASPHYGEHMAVGWLDLARYADSHGYQDDGMRRMWPWRDWVIKSFNKNMPYDKFVKWQLAGDLMPNATEEQILATGFNRNHLQTQEGGVVDEEFRVESVADRTNTFGKAFLGLTMECARCHDHKYDPISQKNYFELYSFFNKVNEAGQIPYIGTSNPSLTLHDSTSRAELEKIKNRLATIHEKEENAQNSLEEDFQSWKKNALLKNTLKDSLLGFYEYEKIHSNNTYSGGTSKTDTLDLRAVPENPELEIKGYKGKGLNLSGDIYAQGRAGVAAFDRHTPFTVGTWLKTKKDSVAGPIFSFSGGRNWGFKGYECLITDSATIEVRLVHQAPQKLFHAETTTKIKYKEWQHVSVSYDGSSKGAGVNIFINGVKQPVKVLRDELESSILYAHNGGYTLWANYFSFGRRGLYSLENCVLDNGFIYSRELSELEVKSICLEENEVEKLKNTISLSEKEKELLKEYFQLSANKNFLEIRDSLEQIRAYETKVVTNQPEIMVMDDGVPNRKTYILNRGQYDSPTTEVFPATPESILAFSDSLPKNRLGLAEWVFDENNPLPMRVAINRMWQQYFGTGLVKSTADFGNQGDFPTHLDLLDWLVNKFRSTNYDVKAMQKLIIMSATYQQNSNASKKLLELDPDNLLLARGPAFRLTSEMVRDNALAVSGLLVKKIGGESVKPYQPSGIWEELATRNAVKYVQQHGDSLYRRSMYTIWKRTSPPPMMTNFDASERNYCNVKRQKTNTPLQALTTMNDPQFVEASRKTAENLIKLPAKNDKERIQHLYKITTSETPNDKEIDLLYKYLNELKQDIENNESEFIKILNIGESPIDETIDKKEIAAWTNMANLMFNHDGTIIRR